MVCKSQFNFRKCLIDYFLLQSTMKLNFKEKKKKEREKQKKYNNLSKIQWQMRILTKVMRKKNKCNRKSLVL